MTAAAPADPPMSAAVLLEGVGKRYWKVSEQATLLRSMLPLARPTRSEIWALRSIDLRVEPGETVGLLGRNGAGKTSLLRLLAGVSRPTEGRVRVAGRIAPLIGVGVGFHREMSGRENVYVNGMLLGLTRTEIGARFADIVAFAELGDFIDTPVKFYSSGMFMRLGFSVAIHVEPRILLVDEVLAVGDIAFQLKCFDRMRHIQRSGTTIILVSHSMHAIRLLCPRAVLLRHGQIEFDGGAERAISRHHEVLTVEASADAAVMGADGVAGGVSVLAQELRRPHGPEDHATQDVAVVLRTRLRFDQAVDSPHIAFDVLAEDGTLAYEMRSVINRAHRSFTAGEQADVEVDFLPRLGGGTYRLVISVTSTDARTVYYRDPVGTLVYLTPALGTSGIAALNATIRLDGQVINDYDPVLLGGPEQPAPGPSPVLGGTYGRFDGGDAKP